MIMNSVNKPVFERWQSWSPVHHNLTYTHRMKDRRTANPCDLITSHVINKQFWNSPHGTGENHEQAVITNTAQAL